MRRMRIAALAAGFLLGTPLLTSAQRAAVQACADCHRAIVTSYLRTAHFHTSAPASSATIKGSFAAGRNTLTTRRPGVSFVMREIDGRHTQTAYDRNRVVQRETIDLVIGSGRRGQSFAYWRDGILYQLPVSWLASPDRWINSPGYLDGTIDFTRIVQPRCLECHATRFDVVGPPGALRYAQSYEVGLTCEKCHGDGVRHVAWHRANPEAREAREIRSPAGFSRQGQLDTCGLCHGGPREPRRPAFSYRPGERLDDYYAPPVGVGASDVHGNQVGLLERSLCFRASRAMTCATCHDVHRTERRPAVLSGKCLACHQPGRHSRVVGITAARLAAACVDCHMPDEQSGALEFNSASGQGAMRFRNHTIGVYPAATAAVLRGQRSR